ncbi:MlaE family ABC transporter permease [Desulfobaculum bizertense]|uniref:Permease MlaE n=1 Tax=Desulfobaculum bizertense DSM 18034 TaxID=1121442 RepID=A0A1T4W502_9BACT|nr:ABC transporter permease [Desulfobaculum bizertense]UIJ38778.1 ABC transporter permease [Desulfobaculum bizertense]SKA71781.1 Permease MlaE [Desulfobaculum bizertense DSM 18034]
MLNRLKAFVIRTGQKTLRETGPLFQMFVICYESAKSALRLRFLNPAVLRVLVDQIHFHGIRSLPGIAFLATIAGVIAVHYILSILTSLGAYDLIGGWLVRSMLHEIAPITVIVYLGFRSGASIIIEIAAMHLHGEIDTLHSLNINLADYVAMPRLLALLIAGPSLTFAFCIVGLVGGFFIMGFSEPITFGSYVDSIAYALSLSDLGIMFLKSFFFSLALGVISLQRGRMINTLATDLSYRLTQCIIELISFIVILEIVFIFTSW